MPRPGRQPRRDIIELSVPAYRELVRLETETGMDRAGSQRGS